MKVIFIGVVGRPVKDEANGIESNGCIALGSISRKELMTKMTKNSNFFQIGK